MSDCPDDEPCPGGGFDYDGQGCPRGICALCDRDAAAHDPDFQPGLA